MDTLCSTGGPNRHVGLEEANDDQFLTDHTYASIEGTFMVLSSYLPELRYV